MAQYAAGTKVSTARSQEEIDATLRRFKAGKTIWMRDDEAGLAVVAFQRGLLTYKFALPFPKPGDPSIRWTPSRRLLRSAAEQQRFLDQEVRRRFRSLANYLKAVLDAVDSGIISAEEALLPYAMLPGGITVNEHIGPQLAQMLETGVVPGILGALPSG